MTKPPTQHELTMEARRVFGRHGGGYNGCRDTNLDGYGPGVLIFVPDWGPHRPIIVAGSSRGEARTSAMELLRMLPDYVPASLPTQQEVAP